jgi:hypothetical protein
LRLCCSRLLPALHSATGPHILRNQFPSRRKGRAEWPGFNLRRRARLPCPVVNCFVPGDLKITGPDADESRLEQYVSTALDRAREARVDTIVFGSGAARYIPDKTDRAHARSRIIRFCGMAADLAHNSAGVEISNPACPAFIAGWPSISASIGVHRRLHFSVQRSGPDTRNFTLSHPRPGCHPDCRLLRDGLARNSYCEGLPRFA